MSTPTTPTESSGDLTGIRLDAGALRVLAHPLRSRLLSTLRVGGPATATDLAAPARHQLRCDVATTCASSKPSAW